ncbi:MULTISPECIES: hypothetical protein [Salinibaculum]|uniref:hypothetical protein n=1 Tax=Salinibaculum TaxID=2732368 RepID=UPI0030CFC813
MNRREVLGIVATTGVITIAGCSGSEDTDADNKTDTPEADSSDEADTSNTEISNETEQIASENDSTTSESELIDTSPEDVILLPKDLPGEGWEESLSNTESSDESTSLLKNYQRENEEGNRERISTQVTRSESVSGAEAKFDEIGYAQVVGMEPEESQELEIGHESSWAAGTQSGDGGDIEPFSADVIRVRDTNLAAYVGWVIEGTEDIGVIELDEIRSLADTMVTKWS